MPLNGRVPTEGRNYVRTQNSLDAEFYIIANHGFESASFLSNPWFNDATFACLQ